VGHVSTTKSVDALIPCVTEEDTSVQNVSIPPKMEEALFALCKSFHEERGYNVLAVEGTDGGAEILGMMFFDNEERNRSPIFSLQLKQTNLLTRTSRHKTQTRNFQ
jgi:hypothetical protein